MVSRTPKMAALVLCGGQSRRMGHDKALLEVEGAPLVGRVARRMVAVADPVMIAPGATGRLNSMVQEERDSFNSAVREAVLINRSRRSPEAGIPDYNAEVQLELMEDK